MLPWHVIREDGHGNRYRVGSYASRTEAQRVADRLGGSGGHAAKDARAANGGSAGRGAPVDSYLVEPPERMSGGDA